MATVNEKMTAIADPIRSLMKETESLTLDDMASSAEQLVEANADLEKVLYGTDFGGKSQYDEFWDNFQDYGNRTDYEDGFHSTLQSYSGWNDTTFKPKYDIKPTGNAACLFWRARVTDFTKCGVDIDLSKCTNLQNAFFSCMATTHIGVVDASSCMTLYTTQGLFTYNVKMHTIDKLIFNDEGMVDADIFGDCAELQNIVIEGVIGTKFSLKACSKLTHESLMSFINALKDYSGTTSTYTLTLHADAKARLSDAEKAIITQKGWTLA